RPAAATGRRAGRAKPAAHGNCAPRWATGGVGGGSQPAGCRSDPPACRAGGRAGGQRRAPCLYRPLARRHRAEERPYSLSGTTAPTDRGWAGAAADAQPEPPAGQVAATDEQQSAAPASRALPNVWRAFATERRSPGPVCLLWHVGDIAHGGAAP